MIKMRNELKREFDHLIPSSQIMLHLCIWIASSLRNSQANSLNATEEQICTNGQNCNSQLVLQVCKM